MTEGTIDFHESDCARCEGCSRLVPPGHSISDSEGIEMCATCGAEFLAHAMAEHSHNEKVRLVVSQQWAVACALLTPLRMIDLATGERFLSWGIWHPLPKSRRHDIEALAALPCAVDVVGGAA